MMPGGIHYFYGIALFLGAYLIGSIPFGLLITACAGHGDIRTIGSGNIGATNVLRTGNKKLAFLTLVLDGSKGAFAVWLADAFTHDYSIAILAGIAAVVGHIYPCWLKFKGGKGVATAIGMVLMANDMVGIGMVLCWLMVAFVMRFSSLAALVAFVAGPLFAWFLDDVTLFLYLIPLSALVIYKHKDNISRLLSGNEPKIGGQKSA